MAGAAQGPAAHPAADGGLQGERSALAWDRTALTLAVNGALLARAGGSELGWVRVAALVVLALAGLGLLLGRSRYVRRDAAMRGATGSPGPGLIAAAGIVAVGVSVVVLVVVVSIALV